jgi:hypothetical protein
MKETKKYTIKLEGGFVMAKRFISCSNMPSIPRVLAFLFIATLAFPSTYPALATVFWTDGFESYPTGSIHGRDSTWQKISSYEGVTTSRAHTGTKSLHVDSGNDNTVGEVRWYNDLSMPPQGGLVELDWWMYRDAASKWEVVGLANNRVGSLGTVDVQTETGWLETMAFATEGSWLHIFLDIDFDTNPTPYRLSVSTTSSPGTWFGWYSLGATGDYFRYIDLLSGVIWENPSVYWDDFTGSVVPEPATLFLLSIGGLAAMRRRRT